jgi:hypothetical protein
MLPILLSYPRPPLHGKQFVGDLSALTSPDGRSVTVIEVSSFPSSEHNGMVEVNAELAHLGIKVICISASRGLTYTRIGDEERI